MSCQSANEGDYNSAFRYNSPSNFNFS